MKAKLTLILITVLLVTSLFVSCKVEVNEPQVNTVTLRFRTDDTGRSLSATRQSLDEGKYYWYYTATKGANNTSPATGAKTEETPVTLDESGNPDKGLTGYVGPFSLGSWKFTLSAYSSAIGTTGSVLVYESAETTCKINENTTTIDITVNPQKTSDGRGRIVVSKNVKLLDDYEATTVTVAGVDVTYGEYTQTFAEGNSRANLEFKNLQSGSYKVTVKYTKDNVTYASNTIIVNVWNELTTTISGNLDEITVSPESVPKENTDGSSTQEITVESGTKASYVYDVTPTEDTSKNTTVEGTFKKTSDASEDAVLKVVTYPVETAASSEFVVSGGNTAVAGIDIDLSNGEFVEGTTAKITTYVSSKLSDVTLTYTNAGTTETWNSKDASTPTMYEESEIEAPSASNNHTGKCYYDAESGKLVFLTSHFSSFIVRASNEAVDQTTGKAYETLSEAVAGATSGDTLILLKDVESLADTISVTKSLTINLGGNTVKAERRIFHVQNGTLTIQNGTVESTVSATAEKEYWDDSAIRVSADTAYSGTETKEPLGLVIEKDATVIGIQSYGITAFGIDDVTLDVYGKIYSANACISGNGANDDGVPTSSGKITVNIYDGAELTSYGEKLTNSNGVISTDSSSEDNSKFDDADGIYQPNVGGVLNIYGGTITSKKYSAIEVRNGVANISGGTLKSEASEYKADCKSSGVDGPTTQGAAVAVNYWGVGVDNAADGITVTITDGTFEGIKQLVVVNPRNTDYGTAVVKVTVGAGVDMSSYKIIGARRSDSVGIDGNYYVSLGAATTAGETGKIHVNSLKEIADAKGCTYNLGVNDTGTTSIDGNNEYIVDLFQDLYYGDDVTIKNVIFVQGVSLRNNSNVKAPVDDEEATKVTVTSCEVYGCDWEDWIEYVGVNDNGSRKSGWNNAGEGACLLFDGEDTGTGAVDFVVENCKFDGRSEVTDPKKTEGKSRGNGVGFGQQNGVQTDFLNSAHIKNCSFTNIRNHAVQTYSLKTSLIVENCVFNSWGVNSYEEPCKTGQETAGVADYAYAVKGDAASDATNASVTIKNCTFNYTSNSEKNTKFKFKGSNLTPTWTDENNMTAKQTGSN